jgi:mannosyltransferase OCH1-like enzyme
MLIPKIIHYCWLSNDPIPESYQKCMTSWKIKLPDYQFVLWDTKRFDINKIAWTKQAFDVKMYACVSDYIRLYAVYTTGGIYLDMDMEIVKSFDPLLNEEIILGYENHISENLEAGCFGAVKGHPYIRKCMEYFETRHFFDPREMENILSMPVFERHEYINPLILPEIMKNTLQEHFQGNKYKIYSREYFTAKNIVTGAIERTKNTFTIHHFATQYHSEEWRKMREGTQKIKRIFGEQSSVGNVFFKLITVRNRIKNTGLCCAVQHYIRKYITKNAAVQPGAEYSDPTEPKRWKTEKVLKLHHG